MGEGCCERCHGTGILYRQDSGAHGLSMPCPDCLIADHDAFDDACYECGGEGFVYDCMTEYACVDPEWGCDMCERVCSLCYPAKAIEAGTVETERLDAQHESAGRKALPND